MSHHDPNQASFAVKALGAGVSACFADLCTFPLDTIKVRLQVQGEGTMATGTSAQSILFRGSYDFRYKGVFSTIFTMAREEGVRSLYNGLNAGLQRQMCFASVRIGMYDTVRNFYFDVLGDKGGMTQGFLVRILAGSTTGCAAVVLAQPTDVIKVRMQAQGVPGVTKRYKGTWDAYKKVTKQEGRQGLWKGAVPNMARNAIVNTAEVVCYDVIKSALLKYNLMTDNLPCHFVSGVAAGFVTTVVASPVDVIKTRIMNSSKGQYSGMVDCAHHMWKERGLAAFYKGFFPNFYRFVTWNIVLWVTYEQIKKSMTKPKKVKNKRWWND